MSPYDAYEVARKHYDGYTAGTPRYISTRIATYALRLLGLGYDEIDKLLITYYSTGKTRDRIVAAYQHHINQTMNKTKERQAMKYSQCSSCKNNLYQAGVGGPCATCAPSDDPFPPTNWTETFTAGQAGRALDRMDATGKEMMGLVLKMSELESSALATQVGGAHYKDMPIQPVEFITKNGLGFVEGSVIKYVSRWRKKGGVDDLRKARHFLDLLIEMEAKP